MKEKQENKIFNSQKRLDCFTKSFFSNNCSKAAIATEN